ncbi:hypothetical protein ACWDR0_00555 [Streptomyces sp. NPDC003691]
MAPAETGAEGPGAGLRCVHCGRDIGCGPPAAGGPACLGQIHTVGGDARCFPERGAASPRARPPGPCGCTARTLVTAGPDVPPPLPRGAAGRSPRRSPGPAGRTEPAAGSPPGTGTERLAGIGRAYLDRTGPGPEPETVVLPDGAGVCVVRPVRGGGGKVYVAPDGTVLFAPSAMDFASGLAAFLDGARTPPAP